MWFKSLKSELLEAFQACQRAVSARSTLPILSGAYVEVKKDKATFYGTDLETSILVRQKINALAEGKAVIPAKPFLDIIKNLPEAVIEIKVDSEVSQASVTCERNHFFLNTFNPDDFPQVLKVERSNEFQISLPEFIKACRKVVKSASRDETRPILTGVLFEIKDNSFQMVATDSYRLAVKKSQLEEELKPYQMIIPARILDELTKVFLEGEGTISIFPAENQVAFGAYNVTAFSRLIEGKFPNYSQIIPKKLETKVLLPRNELIANLKRLSVFTDANPIKLEVKKNGIKLSTSSPDLGSGFSEMEANVEGKSIEIAFNPNFLLEGVLTFEAGEVSLGLQEPNKPAIVTSPSEADFFYLLMPVKLS